MQAVSAGDCASVLQGLGTEQDVATSSGGQQPMDLDQVGSVITRELDP